MNDFSISNLLQESFRTKDFINPREVFEKKIEELNISENQAFNLIGLDKNSVNPILDGSIKHPNLFNVLKISDFLNINLKDLIVFLIANQQSDKIKKLETSNDFQFIEKNFDIDRLSKVGLINSKSDSSEIKKNLLDFFGFESIREYEDYASKLNMILYSSTKRNFADKMRYFSISSAYMIFERISNPNSYNRNNLKEIVPKIKPYTQDIEKGLLTVCQALYSIGVTVCFQRQLTTSQFRGATFAVNRKPCIVLTDLNQNYATIWYALLHELYHVLFDFESILSQGYHLTGEPDLLLINEKNADDFAQEFFFDSNLLRFIKPHINNELMVNQIAKKNNIHKCFVYRAFQIDMYYNHNKNYWKAYRQHFPEIDETVKRLSPLVWETDSIPQKAKIIKEIFELNKIVE
ncbi:ImmA/IrrE family metallo-endopeptidase [Galbibacter mesophilus]|uniref:ImmA/IrrE family metallo-endopeptidase n=1 Tax=Galbibacter mesophilus TaxID=379069 RepID=UPI00191E4894|nr:hypothetical protein [Galbibacter mesophilus]MCM5663044.1 hypothetical protein [Galbibacter mesophilus]